MSFVSSSAADLMSRNAVRGLSPLRQKQVHRKDRIFTHLRLEMYAHQAPKIPNCGTRERSINAKMRAFLVKMASFLAKKRAKNGVCSY
jgi:hypothetical protein